MGALSLFKDILFPARCARCRKIVAEGAICEKCYLEIEPYNFLRCGRCRARLPANEKICHPDWPFVLGAAAAYQDESVQALIKTLKFENITDAAQALAELIFQFAGTIPKEMFEGGVIVPVPLHSARLRKRGYNQSELIARILAGKMDLPIEKEFLVRLRPTRPQSELRSHEEREINVADCFRVKNTENVYGRKIILLDDVITSGNTLYAAAKALKSAGAKKIIVLTAAMA